MIISFPTGDSYVFLFFFFKLSLSSIPLQLNFYNTRLLVKPKHIIEFRKPIDIYTYGYPKG